MLAVLTVRNGVARLGRHPAAPRSSASLIGTLHGTIFAKIGVPSFVVTLGGLMGWQGLQLWLLHPQGTINFPYEGFVGELTHTNLTRPVGWARLALVVAAVPGPSCVEPAPPGARSSCRPSPLSDIAGRGSR